MKWVYWDDSDSIDAIVRAFSQNDQKVVLATADTIVGLLAPSTQGGKMALDRLKVRNEKPYISLVGSREQADLLIDWQRVSAKIPLKKIMDRCWPGPLTIICPASKKAQEAQCSATGAIAIRMPDHAGIQRLLQQSGPLFSTSANLSGQSVPQRVAEVDERIMQGIGCVVQDHDESSPNQLPSTIIDCSKERLSVLRQGAFPMEKIENLLE